jgi:hypothetical protein
MTDENRHLLLRAYQMLRTARMSALYYENRLWWANFWNFFFEIAIAIGATSSGVAAWALWQKGIGVTLWGIITSVSALSAILKPILAPARYIETSTRQHQGWHSFFFSIDKMILDIREHNDFTKETCRRFDTLYDRMVALHLEDVKCPNERVLSKILPKVNAEFPAASLWMPTAGDDPARPTEVEAPRPWQAEQPEEFAPRAARAGG